MNKNCTLCEYFAFIPGCRGYSAMTPGDSWEIMCDEDVWEINTGDALTEAEFYNAINKAVKCKKFKKIDYKKKMQELSKGES